MDLPTINFPDSECAVEKMSRKFFNADLWKKCFIFVQSASSTVFVAVYAFLIPLFHILFNKTVENLARGNRPAML